MPFRKRRSIRLKILALFRAAIVLLVLFTTSLVYAYRVEPFWVEVVSVPLTLPRLPAEFNNYRIVHISDVHVDEQTTAAQLQTLVNRINAQQPDLVVLTGDYVTSRVNPYMETLTTALQALTPNDMTIAVLGNHDHWADGEAVRLALDQAGIVVLSNDVQMLSRNGATLAIAGLDDVWMNKHQLEPVLERLPSDGAAVLLVHEPDYATTSAQTDRFDLQLSGHSHGGQVRIPLFGAPKLPPWGKKYPSGLYRINQMQLYTTRGVGVVNPRVRFNCRPEVTVLTLQ